ncbi:MAG: hypothetical protein NVS4B7_04680 [Ktedonobacteraceae bacterium]
METGLVIGGHYLLQRLIKQGPYGAVYQGVDQLFQRTVAVKAVSALFIPAYRSAVRMTSQFSYPNIVVLYDLVTKTDKLYLIQEYVEGDDFTALLQTPLQPYDIIDIGRQICSALIYASSSARKICHGDLTPAAILRDRRGLIRVNNFALPSNLAYFTAWNVLGSDGSEPLTDRDLPWGMISEGRRANDTRAIGLLLYQLLTSRPAGATVVEPPADGRLRFPRNIPPELCEVVARTVIRRHPQNINTVEVFSDELKILAETLDPVVPVLVSNPTVQQGEIDRPKPFPPPGLGMMGNVLSSEQAGSGYSAYRNENNVQLTAIEAGQSPSALTVADAAIRPAEQQLLPAYPQAYADKAPRQAQRSSLLWLLVLGLIIFALFFVVGYFAGHLFIPH